MAVDCAEPFPAVGSVRWDRMPPLPEAPDRKRLVFLPGPLLFEGTWKVFQGKPGRTMTDGNGRPQIGPVLWTEKG